MQKVRQLFTEGSNEPWVIYGVWLPVTLSPIFSVYVVIPYLLR
jgi:hypothetical protein